MRIHSLEHVPFENLAFIAQWAEDNGHKVTTTHLYENTVLPGLDDFDLLVVMGGPMNIYEEDKYPWLALEKEFILQAIRSGKKILGICLGAQLIADVLGGKVKKNKDKEIGWFPAELTSEAKTSALFQDFPQNFFAFHWHGDTFDIPPGAIHIARSKACLNQGFVYADKVVGLQFHLETTPEGMEKLIQNCADEIIPGPYVHTAEQMRNDAFRTDKSNSLMASLLQRLHGL